MGHLLTEPRLDAENQVISFENIDFTRKLDNDLWAVLSAVFYDQVRKSLEDEAQFNLKPHIADLRTELRQSLTELADRDKITITIEDGFVGLRDVSPAEQALEVVVGFEGTADVAVGAIPVQ